MEFVYELKIPKERIAVLIGKEGETKQELEDAAKTRMNVDSKEGDITLTGEDSIKIYSLREVVKAIGRGFNPEIAKLLLKQDYSLEVLPLLNYVKNKNHFERIKGRVIGAGGKARGTIEHLTQTHISVYGKTISIIGLPEDIVIAKRAIESLLQGSPHSNVYRWLEKNMKKRKQEKAAEW